MSTPELLSAGVPESTGYGLDRDTVAAAAGGGRAITWRTPAGHTRALRFDDQATVVEDAVFELADLELRVPQGARLRTVDDAIEVQTLDGPEPTIGRPGEPGHAIEGELRIDPQGRIAFRAGLPADLLTASIRYFYGAAATGGLESLKYPVFQAPGGVRAVMSIDPANPTDPERNAIEVDAGTPIATSFVSTIGQPLSLELIAERSTLVPQWDPVAKSAYLAPGGDWQLVAPTGPSGPPSVDLLLGLSALEHVRTADASTVRFVPGQPSYAVNFGPTAPTGPVSLTATCPDSQYPVTTSWLYLNSPSGASGPAYFSQPKDAGLFTLVHGDPVLHQLDLQATVLPPEPDTSTASFPAVPYAGVTPPSGRTETLRRFEDQVLAPARGIAIQNLPNTSALATAAGPTGISPAVTPQGLYAEFADGGETWKRLVFARSATGSGPLQIADISGTLRAALLANQLFLVVSAPDMLQQFGCLSGQIVMDNWTFDLSPSGWLKNPSTMLIVKYCDADLATLVADPDLWTEAKAFNTDPRATAQQLQASAAGLPQDVLHDWNGVLILNCPAGDLPPELAGLAAGISGPLTAHHIGISGSPINVDGGLSIGDSSMFGRVEYSNPGDLTYGTNPYDFRVLSLRVTFANSHVTSFTSQVELLVAELFGERSTIVGGKRGENILFDGTWQRHGNQNSYSFRSTGPNLFSVQSPVLESVTVATGEFATVSDKPVTGGGSAVVSRFSLAGTIRFTALEALDMFSFGLLPKQALTIDAPGLVFSNLFVRMTRTTDGKGSQTVEFEFDPTGVVVDLATSRARPDSVYARLPLAATGFIQGDADSKPKDLGYKGVASPLTAGSLAHRWFGLAMNLDLGSAGGLAATGHLTAGFVAAWSPSGPSGSGYDVQIGIRLPGAQAGSGAISLMGPLRLDVGSISLLDDAASGGYMIRMAQVALGFLGVKFPPGGAINLLLFGNPDPTATTNRLGWYAAYKKDETKPNGGSQKQQLPTARRRELLPPTQADDESPTGAALDPPSSGPPAMEG